MASHRMKRINEDIKRELSAIFRTVKDPRVTAGMISILRVDSSPDLSYATVYVSAMDGMEAAQTAVLGLESAEGYIRHQLRGAIKLRRIPNLRFVADDSIAYSANITAMLNSLKEEGEM